jgi:subtilisin family serine protease
MSANRRLKGRLLHGKRRLWWAPLLIFGLALAWMALANPAFGQAPTSKLDAALAALVRAAGGPDLHSLAPHLGLDLSSPQPAVPVLILTDPGGTASLQAAGYPLRAQIGEVASAVIPLDQLGALAQHPAVVHIEPVRRYRPLLDRSIPEIKANQVRTRQPDGSFVGTTGQGVVVGVVDSGLDWRHADFRRPDGSTRIKFLWDPADPSFVLSGGTIGSPPPSGGSGTVYTEAQINAALQGLGTVNTGDECGHGTHVTGVAAGNGRATGHAVPAGTFVGVAPQADIIAVRVFGADCSFLSGAIDLIQALQFIDQKAAELGRPYVINLSLGTHIGAHDGTSLEEQAIDALVGAGKSGKAVVVSAGNEGNDPIHAGGFFGPPGAANQRVTIDVAQGAPNAALFDFWFDGRDTFTVTISGGGQPAQDLTSQLTINPLNGSKRLFFATARTPSFTLTIAGQSVVSGRFDGWVEGGAVFTSQVEFSRLVGMPGTARNAITVGAYVTKNEWIDVDGNRRVLLTNNVLGELAAFSSPGPTRDGRLKPELTAPGRVIGSTLTADANPGAPGDSSIFPSRSFILRDGVHAIAQGTSMSAPHVSGAVALLLERNRRLEAPQLADILTVSSRQDGFTGAVPNDQWGFGKLDVAAAVALVPPVIAQPASCHLHLPVAHLPTSTPPIGFLLVISNYAATTETIQVTLLRGGETGSTQSMTLVVPPNGFRFFEAASFGMRAGEVGTVKVCWRLQTPPGSALLLALGNTPTAIPAIAFTATSAPETPPSSLRDRSRWPPGLPLDVFHAPFGELERGADRQHPLRAVPELSRPPAR